MASMETAPMPGLISINLRPRRQSPQQPPQLKPHHQLSRYKATAFHRQPPRALPMDSSPTITKQRIQMVIVKKTTGWPFKLEYLFCVIFKGNGNSTGTIDKENYYNSSRRENLLPLNNYEYRNSYKDHYDNQGVRVNPAVLKNLSYSSPAKSTNNNSSNGNSISNGGITEFNGSTRPITPQNRITGQTGNKISNNSNNDVAILTENIESNGISDASKQKNTNGNQLYGYTNSKFKFYFFYTWY